MAEIERKIDNTQEGEDSMLNFATFWRLFILNWQIIVLSVFFFMCGGYLYLRYASPVYQASMAVLIKEGESGRSIRRTNMATAALEGIVTNSAGFDNELLILPSSSITYRVVKKLKLYTTYVTEGNVVDREIYKTSPVIVDLAENRLEELSTTVDLVLSKAKKSIEVEGTILLDSEDGPKTHIIKKTITQLPAVIETPVGELIFQQNLGYEMNEHKLMVKIFPLETMARVYSSKLTVSQVGKTTSVASVVMRDILPSRAIDFLSELVKAYNEDANEDKNEVALKTKQFIEERMNVIKGELDDTEDDLESFKKRNELVDVASNASQAVSSTTNYQTQQVEMQTQLLLVKSLVDYMDNPANSKEIIPANLGLESSAVTKMIDDYNKMVLDRSRMVKNSSEENPVVQRLDLQLAQLWPAIGQSLKSVYRDMQQRKGSVDGQYDFFRGKILSSPTLERAMNNFVRQQEVKSGLYLALLQKREENYISLASTVNKARIISEPILDGRISPQKKYIIAGSFAAGFALPMAILYLLSLMRYRIEGREDVERLTKLRILADVPLTERIEVGKRAVVVRENRNDMMEEAFRGLRTNIKFILESGEKVIMCTSCIPGEGKTFVASNLAMSIALLGKKVLIVGLDIRKPQLVKLFGLTADKRGISNFLSLDEPDLEYLDSQIHHSVLNKNLDVLPAGIIPPNPAEIIARPLLEDAIAHLREKYDYIILDTPPVGLVSDSLSIARVADVTVFVARADYSPKANFDLINSLDAEGKMPKISLVLNGMDLSKKKYGYYYGYGAYGRYGRYGGYGRYGRKYGYGYGYGRYGHYGLYGHYGTAEGKSVKEGGTKENEKK